MGKRKHGRVKLPERESAKTRSEKLLSAQEVDWEKDPYGMNFVDGVLMSNDFGWLFDDSFNKKVYLTNPLEVFGRKLTVARLANRFNGTGHQEWEVLLAYWLLHSCQQANQKRESFAEITWLFNKTFIAEGKEMKRCDVYEHLLPQFELVRELDDELYLKLKFE